MKYLSGICSLAAAGFLLAGCGASHVSNPPASDTKPALTASTNQQTMNEPITRTDEEWKKLLTPEQYRVLRQKGTERAFTGEFWNTKDKGAYRCAACGEELFVSDTKYDSGCGWPSFFQPASSNKITEAEDNTLGMKRVEVMCSKCGGHLGHVLDDGPHPTGLRYCINAASLKFEPKKDETK